MGKERNRNNTPPNPSRIPDSKHPVMDHCSKEDEREGHAGCSGVLMPATSSAMMIRTMAGMTSNRPRGSGESKEDTNTRNRSAIAHGRQWGSRKPVNIDGVEDRPQGTVCPVAPVFQPFSLGNLGFITFMAELRADENGMTFCLLRFKHLR